MTKCHYEYVSRGWSEASPSAEDEVADEEQSKDNEDGLDVRKVIDSLPMVLQFDGHTQGQYVETFELVFVEGTAYKAYLAKG